MLLLQLLLSQSLTYLKIRTLEKFIMNGLN